MDEDLKIIVTSELEADEQASAQRISAQLPDIAKLINQKSKIKVQVEVDNSNVQTEAQKFSKELSRAAQTHKVGVSVGLDRDSVKKMQTELNSLKVNPDISHAMTAQLEKMGIQIDRISGRWEQVNDQEERMLSLSIQGTDQLGRSVSYLQTYDAVTGDINTHLTNVTMNLEKQRQVEAQIAAKAKADNESRISYLTKQKAVLSDVQASYTGAVSAKPVHDTTHLDTLNNKYSELEAKIQSMIGTSGQLDKVQRANIEAEIASLKQLVKEYQNAEYVATKLRTKDIGSIKTDQFAALDTLEKRLQSAGTLTEEFKGRIGGLRGQLESAFDPATLTAFLNSFDKLEGDIATFQEQLRGVNAIYTQIIGVENKMTRTKSAMVGLDPTADKEKLAALNEQLSLYRSQKQALESQLSPYSAIIQYARQAEAAERARLENEVKLKLSEAELADKAREIDQTMQRIPSTVRDLEVRFGQLVVSSDNLIHKMQMLRESEAAYHSAKTDTEKIAAYERLHFLIGECSKEISELNRVQRGDVLNFKFTDSLEKAKADLATVGRQWSALKSDPGLNAQFQQLGYNLQKIDNQMDLNKWTTQFSRFKSEVKAAGKNMQSLGDVLKNNVGKVLQWVSATTLLFRAFSLLRNAISTVVALDTAMIDLRKTTEATEAEYRKFYLTANETAKALGVTTEEVISQTAEWSRLGYTITEAAELAKNSAIFSAVSPEMDIAMATDGLVSVIKAFDIDVEDTMDGIISKVNAVGNAFAVSNADIVEALTRSSSAMAAANNTFDETVALATAAIEITRDAASVGNGLKTLSMRIRGYDEETEEYIGGVEELTGVIADLTKTASNPNGVSLFEIGDPETYRSTYDILSDISKIWDEITDKDQAQLLEALFGKRQAQIGAAMLSNFEQAEKSIKTMVNSAGSAEAEMENIYQSLDYKLNALKETWVGVAQNLFDTDQMKMVVDGLIALSDAVDWLTDKLGLFGTIGLVVVIGHLVKFRSTISEINTAVAPILNTLSGMTFDGSTASVMRYATALSSLDPVQQKLAMSMVGLNNEQQEQIITMMAAVAAMKQYTVAELEKALNIEAGTLANELNIASTERVTVEILKAAVANGRLTQEQMEQILATNLQTSTNNIAGTSFTKLGKTAGAAWKSMSAFSKFSLVAGIVTTALSLIYSGWQKVKQAEEESRQRAIEAAESASDLGTEIADLTNEYLILSKAVLTDKSAKDQLISTQDQLIEKLGIEEDKLDDLIEKYGNLNDAIKSTAITELQEAERDLRGGLNGLENDLIDAAKGHSLADKSINHIITTWGKDSTEVNKSALDALVAAGYISSGSYGERGMELWLPGDGEYDLSNVDGIINAHERLGEMLDIVEAKAGSENEVWNALYNEYNRVTSSLTKYTDGVSSLNENLAQQYTIQGLIGRELPSTQEEFEKYRKDVIDAAIESNEFYGTRGEITNSIDAAISQNSQLSEFLTIMQDSELKAAEISARQKAIAEALVPKTYEEYEEGTSAHFHAMDQWLFDVEKMKAKLGELSEEELEIAYNVVIEEGATTWEEIESAIAAHNNAVEIAARKANVLREKISSIWTNDTYSDIKEELVELSGTLDGITPDAIRDLAEEGSVLAEILTEDGMDAEYLAVVLQSLAKGGAGTNLITEEALALNDALSGMVTEFDRVTEAKARYDKAMAVQEKDENFRSYAEAFEELNAQFEAGTTNSNAFWAAAEFLFGKEQLNAWGWSEGLDEIYKSMQLYESVFSDADSAGAGFIEKLYQMSEAGELVNESGEKLIEISRDSNGVYAFDIDYEDIGLIAEKMGIAEEAVLACFEALSMWGNINFFNIDEVVEKIDNLGLSCETASGKAINVDRLSEQLLTLGKNESEIFNIVKALSDLDGVTLLNATGSIDDITTSLQNLNLTLPSDGLEVKVDYEGLANLLANLGYTREEAENLFTKLSETDGVSLANAEGEVGDLDAALTHIKDMEFAEVTAEVDGVAGAMGDVNETPTDGAVSEIEAIGLEADTTVEKIVNIGTEMDNLNGKEITVYYSVKQKNGLLGALSGFLGFANGTDGAPEGPALVGEEDAELIQSGNRAYLAGTDGPEIVHLNEGDRVYNADETKKILRGSGKRLVGTIPSFEDGTDGGAYTGGLAVQSNKQGKYGVKIDVDVELDDTELEEQLKEKLDGMKENIQEIIGNFEHGIFLMEKNGASNQEIIDTYRKMQDAVHEQAEQYRALGLEDNSDYIQELQKQWWDYEDSINELKQKIVDDILDIVKATSDAVDEIQSVFDAYQKAADEYAENDGFISVDTFQEIMELGPQYLQYLRDENGLLVINEENLNKVLAAKTEQLALDNAMAYVERLRLALNKDSLESLNQLLYATTEATNATWGLVYANLGLLDLTDEQRQAAIHNINTIRALADTAIRGIGATSAETSERLNSMKQGLDDILQYVMDMMQDRIEKQIDGLEDMKETYSEIIELQKESLEKKKEEASRQKTQAENLKEIAKLQAKIDLLDLDGSREAQTEKAALLDELAELQSGLEDDQAEYALNVQTEALDKMEEAYLQEKDDEIAILEDSISSTQKLYDMAIDYIESNWSTLKKELIQWNYEVGSSLKDELVSAWDAAYEAAERYGSFTAALGGIDSDIEKSESGGNTVVGATNYDTSVSKEESIHAIIKEMYANSQAHHAEDAAGKKRLNLRNLDLGAMLAAYGITAIRGNDGVWYVDKVGGELLYEKYRKYIYHDGGIVGGGDIKSNEQLSLLKDKEWVLSEQMVENLKTQIDRINRLSDVMSNLPGYVGSSVLSGMMRQADASKTVNYVTNNSRPIEVNIGDTVIHGADQSTVEQHIAISRDTVSQIAKILKLKM